MRVTVFLSSSVPARRLAARDGGDGGGDGEDGGGETGAVGAGRRERGGGKTGQPPLGQAWASAVRRFVSSLGT